MVAVWEDRGDQKKESHSRGDEEKASVKGFMVGKNTVGDGRYHIQEPYIIKHYEVFAEGYDIIYSHMDHAVLGQGTLLEPDKPGKIKSRVYHYHPYASVLGEFFLYAFHFDCLFDPV